MRIVPFIVLTLLFTGCAHSSHPGEQENRPGSESNELSNPAAKKNAVQGEEGHQVPIDCPLRKKGIDPHNHKPFKEIEAYIAFLEREDRAEWQKPLQVIEALKLKG